MVGAPDTEENLVAVEERELSAMAGDEPTWVEDAIFYEIFPDRFANGDPGNDPAETGVWGSSPTKGSYFGGDLQGIVDHLDYLEELGITAVYLTPIFKAHTNHRYDACDYLSIDPALGTTELLRLLVDSAHKRGIRVILDGVFNHCGSGFWAFEDVKERGLSSRYRDWFFVTSYPICQDPPSYQTCGGVWDLPKLNLAHPEARDYLLRVAEYWVAECDIDGWRLDVPWKVPHEFWRTFRDRLKRIKPDCYIVGEVWRDPRPWLRGDTCDAIMNYPLRDIVLTYCIQDGMDAEDFEYDTRLLRENMGSTARHQMNLLGSHDTPRLLTVSDGDVARAILAYTFVFTYIGAPMIYYGDEIGMTGGSDPDCRRCMPWDETSWNTRIHEAIRLLIGARKKHRALRSGNLTSLLVFNGVFSYLRQYADDEVIVVLNPRGSRSELRISLEGLSSGRQTWRDLYSGREFTNDKGQLLIQELPSRSALVLVPTSIGDSAGD
jgi:glycosidase